MKRAKQGQASSVQSSQSVSIPNQFKSVKRSHPSHGTIENLKSCKEMKSTCRSAFGDVTNTLGQSTSSSEEKQASLKRQNDEGKSTVVAESKPNDEAEHQVDMDSETGAETSRNASEVEKTSVEASKVDKTEGSEVCQPQPNRGIELPSTSYDRGNCGRPDKVPDYACAIFENDRVLEANLLRDIDMDCFDNVQDNYICADDRTKLVDWIIAIVHDYDMQPEIVYNSVQMLDRLLGSLSIAKCEFQLAGAACVYISCKIEDTNYVSPRKLVELGHLAYSEPQLLWMERRVLNAVKFRISYPSSYRFLRRFATITRRANTARLTLARFILELSLLDFRYSSELGSKKAAAALLLSFKIARPLLPWDIMMEHYTGYKVKHLAKLTFDFNHLLSIAEDCGCKATFKRFSDDAHFRISTRPRSIKTDELRTHLLKDYRE